MLRVLSLSTLYPNPARPALGRFVGIYPLLFLNLMVGWYYLAPVQWH